MFSSARRKVEEANNIDNIQNKDSLINDSKIALLNALRKAERVLFNQENEIDHRIPKKIVTDEDIYNIPCNEDTINLLESCFNIDSGAINDQHNDVSKWFRDTLL
jgi:hypothetical protein